MLNAKNSIRQSLSNAVEGASFTDEPYLEERLNSLASQFREIYGAPAEVYVRSPGRAEVIGNHTDYNLGYALSCAISRSTLVALSKRADFIIRVRSNSFPKDEVAFDLRSIEKAQTQTWANYVRGVAQELSAAGINFGGADIVVDSNVPSAGGVSSSASFEVAIAWGLTRLYQVELELLDAALLCKRAENGPLVGTPCGLLDQASVALSQSGKMVLLDFKPTESSPLSVRLIPANLADEQLAFVITVDPEVKRNLGETGYPARRRMCEESLPILEKLLGRQLSALRDVSVNDYESCKGELETRGGKIMPMRVEHIVYENQRVLDTCQALERQDFATFGQLLTASGRSALELYGLDEKTPELTFLVETARQLDSVMGVRNMGGGFSGITLALMRKDSVASYSKAMNASYLKRWNRELQFIDFQLTKGVEAWTVR